MNGFRRRMYIFKVALYLQREKLSDEKNLLLSIILTFVMTFNWGIYSFHNNWLFYQNRSIKYIYVVFETGEANTQQNSQYKHFGNIYIDIHIISIIIYTNLISMRMGYIIIFSILLCLTKSATFITINVLPQLSDKVNKKNNETKTENNESFLHNINLHNQM